MKRLSQISAQAQMARAFADPRAQQRTQLYAQFTITARPLPEGNHRGNSVR
jgi:hypothetical protein